MRSRLPRGPAGSGGSPELIPLLSEICLLFVVPEEVGCFLPPSLPASFPTLPYWGWVGARGHGGMSAAGPPPWLVKVFGQMGVPRGGG